MDEGFRQAMHKRGKKAHVIEELEQQVERFANYLQQRKQKTLAQANREDLDEYLQELEASQPGSARIQARGLALFFAYRGQGDLAELASGLRASAVAENRHAFRLKDFRGVPQTALSGLAALGITNVVQMLEAGKTAAARKELAGRSGVGEATILELVKLSDLARIDGLKGIRARLYYAAGVETPDSIAGWEPEALRAHLGAWVESSGFEGIPPLPKEVTHTVQTARRLPRVVEY